MAFTYNPTLETDKDKVRFFIQDTKENDAFFDDEEIQAMLIEYKNPRNCAIALCYTLSALFAGVPDTERVGPYSVDYKTLSDKYIKLAEALRAQQYRVLSGFSGGLKVNDVKETLKNKELTKYAFSRYMMRNSKAPIVQR